MSQRNPRVSISERSLRRRTAEILQEYAQPVLSDNVNMGMIVVMLIRLEKRLDSPRFLSIFTDISPPTLVQNVNEESLHDFTEHDLSSHNIHNLTSDVNEEILHDLLEPEIMALNETKSLLDRLREWVIQWSLIQECIDGLLSILRENGHQNLPACYKTLLHTPSKKIVLKEIDPGRYFHFGLQRFANELELALELSAQGGDNVTLRQSIHVDGVSLSDSSSLMAWTILGHPIEIPSIEPVLLGCYVGYKDPKSFDDFLFDFVQEDKIAREQGFEVNEESKFKIYFDNCLFIMDAPARSKATHTMGHGSKYGCPVCTQKGRTRGVPSVQYSGKIEHPLRTNESFRTRRDKDHHHQNFKDNHCVLEENENLDMVLDFVIDPMHTVDLGVQKKTIKLLFTKKLQERYNLSNEGLEVLGTKYESFGEFKPLEIMRKPRNLKDNWPRLKASENRAILLHYGFELFRDVLHPDLYNHFLMLMLGIRLLSDPASRATDLDLGNELLKEYVLHYSKFYGNHRSYVVHALLHLHAFVQKHGPLYSFSAYKYENHLKQVVGDVHVKNRVLQQMHRRVSERGMIQIKKKTYEGLSRPIESDRFLQYSFGKKLTVNCR